MRSYIEVDTSAGAVEHGPIPFDTLGSELSDNSLGDLVRRIRLRDFTDKAAGGSKKRRDSRPFSYRDLGTYGKGLRTRANRNDQGIAGGKPAHGCEQSELLAKL